MGSWRGHEAIPRDFHLVDTLRTQNERLREQNAILAQGNESLLTQHEEMAKYCSSVSALADAIIELKDKFNEEKEKTDTTADSLLMLWGQLAASGVVSEVRQHRRRKLGINANAMISVIPTRPAAPALGLPASEAIAASDTSSDA